jgi:hypothetical protein
MGIEWWGSMGIEWWGSMGIDGGAVWALMVGQYGR